MFGERFSTCVHLDDDSCCNNDDYSDYEYVVDYGDYNFVVDDDDCGY